MLPLKVLAPARFSEPLPALMRPAMQAEGPFDVELLAGLDEKLDTAAEDLIWWATALAEARAAG